MRGSVAACVMPSVLAAARRGLVAARRSPRSPSAIPLRAARAARSRSIASQRRAVAVPRARAQRGRPAPVARRAPPAARSRLASAMSRHISGELAAMRVKSRKPPAAKPKSSSASRPRQRSRRPARRPAGAAGGSPRRRCGRARFGVQLVHARAACAPRARARRASTSAARSRAAASAPRCGRGTGRRSPLPAPLVSRPAIGWPGTKRERVAQRRARRRDHVRLGAAGIGDDGRSVPRRRDACSTRPICATGTATSTRSAPATRASSRSTRRASMTPSAQRALQVPRVAADADDRRRPRRRALQRQRERAADQADADDDDFRCATHGVARRRQAPARAASAARKRSFSAGRPTVTRRCSGMP